MQEIMNLVIKFGTIIGILILLAFLLYYAEKICSIIELAKQAQAYDIITKEEEENIQYRKEQERREKELHKKQMETQDIITENERKRTEMMKDFLRIQKNTTIATGRVSELTERKRTGL